MKTNILKTSLLALIIALGSCSKDEAEPINVTPPVAAMSDAEVTADIKTDLQIDEVNNDITELLSNSAASAKGLITTMCTSPTKTTDGAYTILTYDFGTECIQPNGNILKGKIIAKTKTTLADGFYAEVSFDNFYHNNKMVKGVITSKTNFVDKILTTANSQDIEVTFADSKIYKRKGSVTRSFSKGFDTKEDKLDDEFTTTGNWVTIFPDASTNSVTITNPLLIKLSCQFKKHVKGTIAFNRRNGNLATIDFGNGDCAPVWTITRPGKNPIPITKD